MNCKHINKESFTSNTIIYSNDEISEDVMSLGDIGNIIINKTSLNVTFGIKF